jgi:hypothetical protein
VKKLHLHSSSADEVGEGVDEAGGVTDPVVRMVLRAAGREREEDWAGAEAWYARAAAAA